MSRTFNDHPNAGRQIGSGSNRLAGVVAIVLAAWTITLVPGLGFLWGVIFVGWALLGLWSGEVYLIGRHTRADEPTAFWLVGLTWLTMGALWMAFPPS